MGTPANHDRRAGCSSCHSFSSAQPHAAYSIPLTTPDQRFAPANTVYIQSVTIGGLVQPHALAVGDLIHTDPVAIRGTACDVCLSHAVASQSRAAGQWVRGKSAEYQPECISRAGAGLFKAKNVTE